jgi:hypothetical protein
MTVAHIRTVAFEGVEARDVDVQVHIGDSGGGQFAIVGLADKAVAESRERVRAALAAIGLALPFKRITVNLAPADVPKEARITIFPSRWDCSPRWAWCRPAKWRAISHWASSRSTAR